MRERFWELPIESLDREEWEALCDGCGKCCIHKLEDEVTGELFPRPAPIGCAATASRCPTGII